jgi:hypothetical protein
MTIFLHPCFILQQDLFAKLIFQILGQNNGKRREEYEINHILLFGEVEEK